MVATGFTEQTGLNDPAFIPPQEIPIPTQVPQTEESRRLVSQPVQTEEMWEPTEAERDQFATLLNCGKRSTVVSVMGHKVGIESLNVDDDLRVGVFTQKYLGTEAYGRAVALATCAAGVRTIDGRPLYNPLSVDESPESIFEGRLERLRHYHASAIMEIHPHILQLDIDFANLAVKLGKLTG
jgi:hypothetical protein